MAPLTKDSLEIANPSRESSVAQTSHQAKPASGHLRSDAVSLEVSVRVHGSKVKDVVLGTTPHTEPFEEQTITMIIFPQGAVLKMTTAVNVGQMLVVTNLKSRLDAICRVVKVRANANLAAYVEVEFTNRQPGYWGVYFPSDDPAGASNAVPAFVVEPAATSPNVVAPKPLHASPILKEDKPAVTPPQTRTSTAKPAPSFISIGSQEEVQPAASATAAITPGLSLESPHENFAPFASKSPAASEFSPVPPMSLSMPEVRRDAETKALNSIAALDLSDAHEQELTTAASSVSADSSHSTFGSFAGGATLAAARSTSSESFGARLDSREETSESLDAAPGHNWILIAACAGVLIAGLGAGLFYFQRHSGDEVVATARPVATTAAQTVPAAQPSVPANVAQTTTPVPDPAPAMNAPANPVAKVNTANVPGFTVNSTNATKPIKSALDAQPEPVVVTKQAVPKVTPDMMSQSLNMHPTATQRTHASSAAAPSIEEDSAPAPSQPDALPGIASSTNLAALPPPPLVQPEGPVKIGGDVKEPRLISSVVPAYPVAAMKSGIEGNVVIQTTIDKSGGVVEMHVISGSPLLRQAALDALRRWKYEPSTLNGQPVAVQMQVTIKFRR